MLSQRAPCEEDTSSQSSSSNDDQVPLSAMSNELRTTSVEQASESNSGLKRKVTTKVTTENETLQKETTPSDNTNIVMETPLAVSPVHEEEEMCGLLSLTFPIPEKNPLSKKNPEKTEEFITKFKALLRTIQHPEIKKIVCDKASAYDTNKNDEEEPQYAFKNKGDAALMISKINTELKKLVIHNPSACESSIMFAETLSTTTLNTEVTTLIKALKKFSGEL